MVSVAVSGEWVPELGGESGFEVHRPIFWNGICVLC